MLACHKRHLDCDSDPAQIPAIRLLDSAGNDLLNPRNPNAYLHSNLNSWYYDNVPMNNLIQIDSLPASDTFLLWNPYASSALGGRTYFLELSDKDVDTLYFRVERITDGDCGYDALQEFRYNGVEYKPKSYPPYFQAYEVTKN